MTDDASIFCEALDCGSPADRMAFLESACANDPDLKVRIIGLLAAHDQTGSILDAPPEPPLDLLLEALPEAPGALLGPYKLLELIGEGGMGLVYRAEQHHPVRRQVAVKIIKPGMDTRQVIARFEVERHVLALLDHPHIAKVLDAGATSNGRPYFVMELVRGLAIVQFCDEAQLDTRARLKLFISVCQGVQHAHWAGIIHRDLKPANILVTMHDDRPVPRIIDFGIAKATGQRLTEQTLFTNFLQMLGTPVYMSPEQAHPSALEVDARSDIYSLGVILYELLTGSPPFPSERLRAAGYAEIQRILRDEEPPPPSVRVATLSGEALATAATRRSIDLRRYRHSLRGDLDWIVMRALEKDRNRRYESASELANDLQRHLDGKAVQACPPSVSYRFRKFASRNRIAFTTGVLVAGALLLGTVVSSVQAIRATRAEQLSQTRLETEQEARQAAEEATATAQQNAATAYRQQYKAEIHAGLADWQAGTVSRLYATLSQHLPESDRADLRGWEWYYLASLSHQGRILGEHGDVASSVAWSPDGNLIASTGYDADAIVWDVRTGKRVRRFSAGFTLKFGATWSPDSQRLAWGSVGDEYAVRIWDRRTDQTHVHRGHTTFNWSPNGLRLASTAPSGNICIWDAESCIVLRVLSKIPPFNSPAFWTPDGRFIVVVRPHVVICDAHTGEMVRELNQGPPVRSVSMHPSGTGQMVLGTESGSIRWVNTDTWQTDEPIKAHGGTVNAVAFSHDGAMLATAGADGRIRIWHTADMEPIGTLDGHLGPVTSLAWSPDNKQLASASLDRTVRLWQIPPALHPIVLHGPRSAVNSLSWDSDDTRLTSISSNGTLVTSWKREADQFSTASTERTGGDSLWESVSPNERLKAVAFLKDDRVAIRIHDIPEQQDLGELPSDLTEVKGLVWSPDSHRLAAVCDRLHVWDVRTMRSLFMRPLVVVHSVAWAPDSVRLAVAGRGDPVENGYTRHMGNVHVFDVDQQTRLLRVRLGPNRGSATSVAWHPRGTHMAGGNADGQVMVWETETGRPVASALMHRTKVRALDWSPDGRRIVSVSDDGSLKVWDAGTGDELCSLTESVEPLWAVKWSSNGQMLAAAADSGRVTVWDASAGYEWFQSTRRGFEHARMREEVARQLVQSRDFAGAIVQVSRAIELAPDRASYRRLRGLLSTRVGRLDEALVDLSAAVNLDPDDVMSLLGRTDVYAARGDWKAALTDALRILALKQDSSYQYQVAMIHLMLGRTADYQQLCQEMFDRPSSTSLHVRPTDAVWTGVLMPNGLPEYDTALRIFREAIAGSEGENHPKGVLSLGALLYRAGRVEESIEPLSRVSQDFEEYGLNAERFDFLPGEAWYVLALAQHDLGHHQEARNWFDKAESYTNSVLRHPPAVASRLFHEDGSIFWPHRVALEHLQREARAKLGESSSTASDAK